MKDINGITDYKDIVIQIKNIAKEFNKEYIPKFSKSIRRIIKENRNIPKTEIKRKIYVSTMATISKMSVDIARKVEDLIGEEDEYTKGHVGNTSEIANKIAEVVVRDDSILAKYIKEKAPQERPFDELDEAIIERYKDVFFYDIYAGGLLHDIGKLAISMKTYPEVNKDGKIEYYSLLTLPRKLTEDEFEIIKTHTDLGYNILMQVAEEIENSIDLKYKINVKYALEMIGQGILYHHERVDGNGYHKLANEKIPVIAKIIQTADIYDALTSVRPYKNAWSDEEARAEMRKYENVQCDKIYLDALDEVVKAKQENLSFA